MKILSYGKPPEERVHRLTCTNCYTVIEIKEGEGKVTHSQKDGSYISYKCPVCEKTITKDLDSNRPIYPG